jgi:hypothetical protein
MDHTLYYKKLLTDKQFISAVVGGIKTKLGRSLVRQELIHIYDRLTRADPDNFVGMNKQDIYTAIVNGLSTALVNLKCEEDPIDIHEIQKSSIGVASEDINIEGDSNSLLVQQVTESFASQTDITSIFGSRSWNELKSIMSPESVKKTVHVLADTRYRLFNNDNTVISWNFVNNANATQGTVNVIGDVQNIVGMKIHPFKIPYLKSADNDYGRVAVLVNEFSGQSYIGHENSRFHVMFQSVPAGKWIDLQTTNSMENEFKFKTPITRLDTLTISFGSPLEAIIFDNDRINMEVISYTNPGITILNNAIIAHNLETNDLVYFTNFTTLNPDIDINQLSAVNNPSGVIITRIDDNTISIPVDVSILYADGPGTIDVVNGSDQIVGTGTTFTFTFRKNDYISIFGVKYIIFSIQSDTMLSLLLAYADVNASGVTYKRDNTIPNLTVSAYFGSKRMFIPIEFEYLDA